MTWTRGGFLPALLVAALGASACEGHARTTSNDQLPHCPQLSLFTNSDGRIVLRNNSPKALSDVVVFVAGTEKIGITSQHVSGYRAELGFVDTGESVDVSKRLALKDGRKWSPLTMTLTSATVSSKGVCETDFEPTRGIR